MADYETVRLAGLTTPLTASTSNSLLQDADPALYWFTQWCEGVLQEHLGDRWDSEVTAMGQASLSGYIVRSTVPYDPVPHFHEAEFPLPLLAIYRVGSNFNDATTTWIRRVSTWGLDYVLPPLSAAQLERLSPIRSAIEAVLYDRINHDADPAVLSGARLATLMQTESIKVLESSNSHSYLQVASRSPGVSSEATLFPLLSMRFEVAERQMPYTSYEEWEGADISVQTPDELEVAAAEVNQE